jgi:spore coat protein U-like protein
MITYRESRNHAELPRSVTRLGLVLLTILAVLGSTADAACNMQLDNIGNVSFAGGSGSGYDVFDTGAYPQAVPVTISNKKGACSYFLTFSGGQAGSYTRQMRDGGNILQYQLFDTASRSNILKDLPSATAGEILHGTLNGREEPQHDFYLVIPQQQVVPPGVYRDTITVTLYEGSLSSYTEVRSRNVRIQAAVGEQIDVSVTDNGMPFDAGRTTRVIDFGILTEGATSIFDMLVRSNAGYSVMLESQNGGAMKILDPTDPSIVPYVFQVNGAAINLSGDNPVTVSSSTARTPPGGITHDMNVTVGAIGNATAGDYEDNITITVIANP